MKKYFLFVFLIVLLILLGGIVFAQGLGPGVPHHFYGSVSYNNETIQDGIEVAAYIDNEKVASTTTLDGKYGYDLVFKVLDPDHEREGKVVNFYVSGFDTGQSYVFENGASTELDLIALSIEEATCYDNIQNQGETGIDCGGPCEDCIAEEEGTGGGSAGGGGGGGGSSGGGSSDNNGGSSIGDTGIEGISGEEEDLIEESPTLSTSKETEGLGGITGAGVVEGKASPVIGLLTVLGVLIMGSIFYFVFLKNFKK